MIQPLGSRSSVSLPTTLAAVTALALLAIMTPRSAAAFTVAQGNLVNQGFTVFNTQTFNGNGRTCTTCHIPTNDYTISPADIAKLPAAAHKLVLGGTNTTLENPILVNKFAVFNIDNNTPGVPGTGNTPTGPFRTSMQISGLALTTLNDCPDATLIATADDSDVTAQITTVKPPVYPFVVGEKINIGGVSVAGYNGIGIYKISTVINPTTFQYVKQFGPPGSNGITGLAAGSGGAVNGLPATGAGVCTTPPNFVTFPVDTVFTVQACTAFGTFYRNGYNKPNRSNRPVLSIAGDGQLYRIPLAKRLSLWYLLRPAAKP